MKGDAVPDPDHISRWCGGSHVNPETGAPAPGAFMLRPADKDRSLSVNWLEFLRQLDRQSEISEIQRILAKKLRVGSRSRIAVLNVFRSRVSVSRKTSGRIAISVEHDPVSMPDVWDDPSHSGIYGLPLEESDEPAIALAEAVIEIHPAVG